jgi:hypothetical protein
VNAQDLAKDELMRISFVHYQIKQNEIATNEDLMRIQSKPIRRNVNRFIK